MEPATAAKAARKAPGTGGGAGTKTAKVKDGVDELLRAWFQKENKPAALQGACDALQSKVSKPLVQKSLDNLATLGELSVKDFKKIKIYFPSQTQPHSKPPEAGAGTGAAVAPAADPVDFRARCVKLEQEKANIALENRRLEVEIQAAANVVTLPQLEAAMAEATAALHTKRVRLARLSDAASGSISLVDATRHVKRYQRTRTEWRRRRVLGKSLVEHLRGEETEAAFADALGLELSDDGEKSCHIEIPAALALPPWPPQ